MKSIYLKAISHFIPEGRVSNEERLEEIRKDNAHKFDENQMEELLYGCQRKFDFLGVETRSVCKNFSQENIVTMATKASLDALQKASLTIEDIDCLLVTGVTNPFREPSFAILVANQLGMKKGNFFDINDTCNGFLKTLEVASLYLQNDYYKNILVVSSENPDEVAKSFDINFEIESEEKVDQKFSSFFLGAGSAAAVISSEKNDTGMRIINYAEFRESDNWDVSVVTFPNTNVPGAKFGSVSEGFWTDAQFVSSEIIKQMPPFVNKQLADWNLTINDFDVFILHQLGNNITFATLDKINAPHSKAPVNTFNEYGNMGSANIPVNLSKAVSEGYIKKGDSVLLLSSGCGLTYSVLHIKW